MPLPEDNRNAAVEHAKQGRWGAAFSNALDSERKGVPAFHYLPQYGMSVENIASALDHGQRYGIKLDEFIHELTMQHLPDSFTKDPNHLAVLGRIYEQAKKTGHFEAEQVEDHPDFEKLIEASGLKDVGDFWHSYEKHVHPTHFAAVHHLQQGPNGDAVYHTLTDHRGQTGSSEKYAHILPKMREYASKTQQKILEDIGDRDNGAYHLNMVEDDENGTDFDDDGVFKSLQWTRSKHKSINGEPHVLLYRGVAGDYGKKLLESAGFTKESMATNAVPKKSVTIHTAPFSSWTVDYNIANRFALDRQIDGQANGYGAVIAKWTPVKHVLHSGWHDVYPGQQHAHEREHEFVVEHPEGELTIHKHEIVARQHWAPAPATSKKAAPGELTPSEDELEEHTHKRSLLTYSDHLKQRGPDHAAKPPKLRKDEHAPQSQANMPVHLDDDLAKLLMHPDINERTIALKSPRITPAHVVWAAKHLHETPLADGKQTAIFDAIKEHPEMSPEALHHLLEASRGFTPNGNSRYSIQKLFDHPMLDASHVDTMHRLATERKVEGGVSWYKTDIERLVDADRKKGGQLLSGPMLEKIWEDNKLAAVPAEAVNASQALADRVLDYKKSWNSPLSPTFWANANLSPEKLKQHLDDHPFTYANKNMPHDEIDKVLWSGAPGTDHLVSIAMNPTLTDRHLDRFGQLPDNGSVAIQLAQHPSLKPHHMMEMVHNLLSEEAEDSLSKHPNATPEFLTHLADTGRHGKVGAASTLPPQLLADFQNPSSSLWGSRAHAHFIQRKDGKYVDERLGLIKHPGYVSHMALDALAAHPDINVQEAALRAGVKNPSAMTGALVELRRRLTESYNVTPQQKAGAKHIVSNLDVNNIPLSLVSQAAAGFTPEQHHQVAENILKQAETQIPAKQLDPDLDNYMGEIVARTNMTDAQMLRTAKLGHLEATNALADKPQLPQAVVDHVLSQAEANPQIAGHFVNKRKDDKTITADHLRKLWPHVSNDLPGLAKGVLEHVNAPEDLHMSALDDEIGRNSNVLFYRGNMFRHVVENTPHVGALRHALKLAEGRKESKKPEEAARIQAVELIKERLSHHDPDSVHQEGVQVRLHPGIGKLRKLRDIITEMQPDKKSMSPKHLPAGDWSKYRLPNGEISADLIQKHIDSIPSQKWNVSHSEWEGAQRHSEENSNVFQLNLTTEHVNKLKQAGVYQTFQNMVEASHNSDHPVSKLGIGWVRHTGAAEEVQRKMGPQDPEWREWAKGIVEKHWDKSKNESDRRDVHDIIKERFEGLVEDASDHGDISAGDVTKPHGPYYVPYFDPQNPYFVPELHQDKWPTKTEAPGIQIDEIQSDLGQSFIKQAQNQVRLHAEREAREQGMSPDEASEHVNRQLGEATKRASLKWPEEHHQKISQILFQGRHPNEVLAEAFTQHLRDQGHHDLQVHVHQPKTKATLSGLDTDRKLPGHTMVTYDETPKKLGAVPAQYGELSTQTNPDLKGKDQWMFKVRKSEPDFPTELTKMALKDVQPGAKTESGVHDYTHLLPNSDGHKLFVSPPAPGHNAIAAWIEKDGKRVGSVLGHIAPNKTLEIRLSALEEKHRGKGWGSALYEATMAHAYHSGVRQVGGDEHSAAASKVHEGLAQKHGLDYDPMYRHPSGSGAYDYTLKSTPPIDFLKLFKAEPKLDFSSKVAAWLDAPEPGDEPKSDSHITTPLAMLPRKERDVPSFEDLLQAALFLSGKKPEDLQSLPQSAAPETEVVVPHTADEIWASEMDRRDAVS